MNTLAEALEEYDIEDENGQHKLVYSYFGLAIYSSQTLEETFSIMLWTQKLCDGKTKTNFEINEVVDVFQNSKKTMGQIINDVKEVYNLPEELVESLKDILDKHNNLVHRYFKNEIHKFYTSEGRKEMLTYFCDFIDDIKLIDSALLSYYEKYKLKLGITDNLVLEMMDEMEQAELQQRKNLI